MKEYIRQWTNSLGRKASSVLLATSMVGGAGPPTTPISVFSCEHFLTNYTPAVDATLQGAIDALRYNSAFVFTTYPDPTNAREMLSSVVTIIEKEPAAGQEASGELEDVTRTLPQNETLFKMQQSHVNNTTFGKERREIQHAKSQLDQVITMCEKIIPTSLRRDSWYRQEQFRQMLNLFWDKYRIEIFIILGFVGAEILEKLFIENNTE